MNIINREVEQKSILNSLESLSDKQIHVLNEFIRSFVEKSNNLEKAEEEFIDNNLIMKNNPETYSFLQNDCAYSSSDLKEAFQ